MTMMATSDMTKPILPSCMCSINCRNKIKKFLFLVVVQEEGARKVFVYLNIPELKVKRSFPNLLKFMPSNGHEKVVDFQNQ
jgi:hypothetical protein